MAFFKKRKLYLPGVLWALIILVLSGYPGNKIPELPVLQIDKIVHAFMYAVLAICMAIPSTQQFFIKNKRWSIRWKIILFGVFYGGLMEVLQTNIYINRSGNWYDFLANTLGAILGILFFPYLLKIVPITRWMKIR
jgi:VanZ family protein